MSHLLYWHYYCSRPSFLISRFPWAGPICLSHLPLRSLLLRHVGWVLTKGVASVLCVSRSQSSVIDSSESPISANEARGQNHSQGLGAMAPTIFIYLLLLLLF